jgi:hypothetical protein
MLGGITAFLAFRHTCVHLTGTSVAHENSHLLWHLSSRRAEGPPSEHDNS